jgi:hypothetical protein
VLICYNRKLCWYIRAVSGQQLCKPFLAATDMNATMIQQQARGFLSSVQTPLLCNGSLNITFLLQLIQMTIEELFSMWSVSRCYKQGTRLKLSLLREAVKRGLQRGSWRIPTVRSRYEGTAGENTGWKMLSGCCGDWWIVEINCGLLIDCRSESCV